MGLGGCYSLLKYLLVCFNLLFLVLGFTGIVFGVWMLVDSTFTFSLTQEYTDYTISVILILVTSIVLVIVAIVGIYGALKESQCALTTFFSLLFIIFAAEIAAGVWVYINSNSLELQLRNAVTMTVKHEYNNDENRKLLFDSFHRNMHCCGSEKPTDWVGNRPISATISSSPTVYNIPESCCREGITPQDCQTATRNVKVGGPIDYNAIYDQGCYTLILSKLKEYACIFLIVGIVVATIQVLGLIFALILAFAVNKSNRYKA